MWLRDAGEQWSPAYRGLYDTWLSTLERRGVLGIGFGLISLIAAEAGRHPSSASSTCLRHGCSRWPPDVERWFAVQDVLAGRPGRPALAAAAARADVVRRAAPRASADPSRLRSCGGRTGMAWSGPVDPFGLDLLAALDGVRPAAEAVLVAAGRARNRPRGRPGGRGTRSWAIGRRGLRALRGRRAEPADTLLASLWFDKTAPGAVRLPATSFQRGGPNR